jgi:hypothetical protein
MQRFSPDSDKLFLRIRTDIYRKSDEMRTRVGIVRLRAQATELGSYTPGMFQWT